MEARARDRDLINEFFRPSLERQIPGELLMWETCSVMSECDLLFGTYLTHSVLTD